MLRDELKALLNQAIEAGLKKVHMPAESAILPFPYGDGESLYTDSTIESRILEFLKSRPELSDFGKGNFLIGTAAKRVSFKALLRSLLFKSQESGIEQTLDDLERFVRLDHIPSYEILILTGIEVEEGIDLTDSLRLAPLSELPKSPETNTVIKALTIELHDVYTTGLGMLFGRTLQTTQFACLIRNFKSQPKTIANEGDVSSTRQIRGSIFEQCLLLTLAGQQIAPLPFIRWFCAHEWVPCARHFESSGWGQSNEEFGMSRRQHTLSKSELDKCSILCRAFEKADASTRDRLFIPITRIHRAKLHDNLTDCAVELGTALEALTLDRASGTREIAFRLSLQIAWQIGKTREEREDIFRRLNGFYSNCRSKAVHSGVLDDKVKIPGMKGKHGTAGLLRFVEETCRKSIETGLVENRWPEKEGVFGS